eukprot:jgi/Chlat1/8002/Chrsp7S07754
MAQPYWQYNQQQQDPLQALAALSLAGVGGGTAAAAGSSNMSSVAASPLASLHSIPPRAPPTALPPLSPGSLVSAFGIGSSSSNLISPSTSTTSSPPAWTAFPPAVATVEDDDDPFAALATRRTASAPSPLATTTAAQAQAQPPATASASAIETLAPDLGRHLDDFFANKKAPPPPPPRRESSSQQSHQQQQQHQQQAQQQAHARRLPSGGVSGGSTAPPCFELRPPPIRLDSSSITVLAEAAGSLWSAGQGGYLRVWQSPGSIFQGGGAGEEDTAACALLPVAAGRALCMSSYPASALMLTGHADGFVRAWSAQLPKSLDSATPASPTSVARNILRECELLAWPAHRTPVTALALTPYGDLWTGTDTGSIRVWSRNSLAQALKTGRPLTACGAELVHRTAGQGKPSAEVRQLVYVPGTTRLWSLTAQSVCIWNTRTCELVQCIGQEQLLGYTGMSGADDFGDAPILQKSTFWGRARSSLAATAQAAAGQWSTLSTGVAVSGTSSQQWGSGLFGAGDKGGICAIAAAPDGTVWGGCVDGRVIHWEGEGLLIAAAKPLWKGAVKSICAVGLRVWAGSATGSIRVLDGSNGGDLGAWKAHDAAVASMTSCGDYVFSLASTGHIRGWDARSPCDADAQIRFALEQNAAAYTVPQTVRLLAGTWNVNEQKPAVDSLRRWLGGASAGGAQGADVVCVGLQETEMSAGSIFLATAKETVGVGLDGSGGIAGMWLQAITLALGGEAVFVKVAARQLAGILIGVWVRRDILRYVSEADTATAAVACGLMGRTLGNKGGVAVRLVLHRRNVCLINSHFAAHTEAVSRRNADYEHIITKLAFPARSVYAAGSGGMHRSGSGADLDRVGSGNSLSNGSAGSGFTRSPSFSSTGPSSPHSSNSPPPLSPPSQEQKGSGATAVPLSGLSECDTVVWVGDMNYRVQVSYAEALAAIAREDLALLLRHDQLHEEKIAKRVFQGFVEPPITFPPTYKFDKHNPDRLAYDSSEKQRVPAWCDRVLIREDISTAARVDVERYDSCMSVLDSDHKPVAALLRLALQAIDQASLRKQYQFARATAYQAVSRNPQHMLAQATALSDNALSLTPAASSKKLRLSNKSNKPVVFSICVDPELVVVAGQQVKLIGPLSSALPRWMTIFPSTGVVLPRAAGTLTITMSLDNMRSMKEVGDDSSAWHDELPRNGLSMALLVTVHSDWFDQSTTHRVSLSCDI